MGLTSDDEEDEESTPIINTLTRWFNVHRADYLIIMNAWKTYLGPIFLPKIWSKYLSVQWRRELQRHLWTLELRSTQVSYVNGPSLMVDDWHTKNQEMKIWLRYGEFIEVRHTINPSLGKCLFSLDLQPTCDKRYFQSFGLKETFIIESAPQYLLGELFLSQYIFVSRFLSEEKHTF